MKEEFDRGLCGERCVKASWVGLFDPCSLLIYTLELRKSYIHRPAPHPILDARFSILDMLRRSRKQSRINPPARNSPSGAMGGRSQNGVVGMGRPIGYSLAMVRGVD
jgi:hypothetical protein